MYVEKLYRKSYHIQSMDIVQMSYLAYHTYIHMLFFPMKKQNHISYWLIRKI